jgi:glutathione synthase/RimK-type ligase-like ATP-grasp enzyme
MILLCGIPSETPLNLVRQQLSKLSVPSILFNQRQFKDCHLDFEVSSAGVRGSLQLAGCTYRLQDIQGIYVRLMDDRSLPELENHPPDSPLRRQSRLLHDALLRWIEIAPARVVNRMRPMASNGSKPYQAQLIQQCGFLTPETLVTNQPELVIDFARKHGRIIYKSVSGVRSIVQELHESDFPRLDHIRWCPTQFQQYIDGFNVRVHTIGEHLFATAIDTNSVDYRYATRQEGGSADLRAFDLTSDLADRCHSLARQLGLAFAGIDLKFSPDGSVYCFEVNPSPAYSYYESHTGQPIARAVASYLAGR